MKTGFFVGVLDSRGRITRVYPQGWDGPPYFSDITVARAVKSNIETEQKSLEGKLKIYQIDEIE
jgi:hypothetical protein